MCYVKFTNIFDIIVIVCCRLHPSALFIMGLGVAPDYAPDQVKHSCLSIF